MQINAAVIQRKMHGVFARRSVNDEPGSYLQTMGDHLRAAMYTFSVVSAL